MENENETYEDESIEAADSDTADGGVDSDEDIDADGDGPPDGDDDESFETVTSAANPTAKRAESTAKAHELFLAGCMATARALGLTYEEKAGFHKWLSPANKQKVYVAKQAKEVTVVETTLSRDLLGSDITQDLEKGNGKIECRIVPTLENVQFALQMLADPKTPSLRAAKRVVKAPAAAASK